MNPMSMCFLVHFVFMVLIDAANIRLTKVVCSVLNETKMKVRVRLNGDCENR